MLDQIELSDKSSMLWRATMWRRLKTGVMTALGSFLLVALIWPLNVAGYRTEARIDLTDLDQQQQQALLDHQLPTTMQHLLDPANVEATLARLQADTTFESQILKTPNPAAIANRTSLGFKQATAKQPAQLRVVFDGVGTPDEKKWVAELAGSIMSHLQQRKSPHGSDVDHQHSNVPTSLASHQRLDRAEWLVDQIEEGLSSAKTKAVGLIANPPLNNAASAFQNAAHVSEVETPAVDSLHQTLDSVDVASLRGVIQDMKTDPSLGGTANSSVADFDMATVEQTPVGAIPDQATIMLLSMVSLLIGSVVAWNIRPFTQTGFDSVDEVAQSLGIPVVATLGTDPRNTLEKQSAAQPNVPEQVFANRVALFCSSSLIGLSALAAGFWLFYPSVRAAFGESLFHGLARIVWLFVGA